MLKNPELKKAYDDEVKRHYKMYYQEYDNENDRYQPPQERLDEFNKVVSDELKRFFYDGWFPLFPWFIIVLMGALSFKYNSIKNRLFLFLLISIGLSALIFLVFYFNMTTFIVREKYFEIWYPLYGIKLLLPIAVILIISF